MISAADLSTPHVETPTTLVMMFRRPAPGHGKQRLAQRVGARAAAELGARLLACALEDLQDWPGPRVLAPDRPADVDWAATLLPRTTVVPQPDGNLGDRLNAVDRHLRDAGHRRTLYIGSDAPSLDIRTLADAADTLSRSDAVLIPAHDGGVVAMGNRLPWPVLATLPWSTGRLCDALMTACRVHGLSVNLQAKGHDVDTIDDLRNLRTRLAGDARPARQQLLAWLAAARLPRSPEHR